MLTPSRSHHVLVQGYKEQFLLTQQQRHQDQGRKRTSNSRAPTREESLMSIADAICPPGPRPEVDSPNALVAMRRGHSVSQDNDLSPSFLFPSSTLMADDNQTLTSL